MVEQFNIFEEGILSLEELVDEVDFFEDPTRFVNRELSWLEFNRRVLEEVNKSSNPLLEKIKFLSISAHNLDEFFMVRVAGIAAQMEQHVDTHSIDGLSPAEQMDAVSEVITHLQRDQQSYWKQLQNEMAEENIFITKPKNLTDDELNWLRDHFLLNIFPVLTPLSIDMTHPFPFISNQGHALVFELVQNHTNETMNAFVRIPSGLDRFVILPQEEKGKFRAIAIEDIIASFVDLLFPDYAIVGYGDFRVIRDSDIELADDAEDLVLTFETALKHRRRGRVIRIEINSNMPEDLRKFVYAQLNQSGVQNAVVGDFLDLHGIAQLNKLDRTKLKFEPFSARFPERVRQYNGDCFAAIREKDFLVHHPYESFDVVVQFLRQAAEDPDVLAIKQTLYRTSENSPVIAALIEAAEAGKSVVALIELKARFEEEANIRWARDLERAGVQVVFGFIGWKTHSKLSLVVRKEGDAIRNYVHIGTGNYHPITARQYTDLSYFTADPVAANDVARVFNFITGHAKPNNFETLAVSPVSLRDTLMSHIQDEIQYTKAGRQGHICAKMNALVDPDIIDAFYRASQEGVKIELVVRGICCLRPNIAGLSENITVKSIIGRFLEHSRIICFGGGAALPSIHSIVYMGSSDLMPRNLNRRVETMVRLEDETVRKQVLEQIMAANLKDTELSWEILPDGTSRRIKKQNLSESFNSQTYFMTNPSLSGRGEALNTDAPKRFFNRWTAESTKEK